MTTGPYSLTSLGPHSGHTPSLDTKRQNNKRNKRNNKNTKRKHKNTKKKKHFFLPLKKHKTLFFSEKNRRRGIKAAGLAFLGNPSRFFRHRWRASQRTWCCLPTPTRTIRLTVLNLAYPCAASVPYARWVFAQVLHRRVNNQRGSDAAGLPALPAPPALPALPALPEAALPALPALGKRSRKQKAPRAPRAPRAHRAPTRRPMRVP